MSRKNVTTPATNTSTVEATVLPKGSVTPKQVKMIKIAASGMEVALDLPQVEVTDAHRLAAEAELASFGADWLAGVIAGEPAKARAQKRSPRTPDQVREEILAGLAARWAMAEVLTGLGHTSKSVALAIDYAKQVKNRRDMSSRRKAEEFIRRLGLPGAYRSRETATAVALTVPVSRGLTGSTTAGIAGRAAGGLIAAEPAPAAEPSQDPIARLLRLKEALELGLIDEAEYTAARAAVVALL